MIEQHRAFFAALAFMVVGPGGPDGHPWATTCPRPPPGFMKSANENRLPQSVASIRSDPLHSCIRDGVPSGGLGSNFHSTRRATESTSIENCISGRLLDKGVSKALENCPEYIHAVPRGHGSIQSRAWKSEWLPSETIAQAAFIAEADHVFFSASASGDATRPRGLRARSRRLPPVRTSRFRAVVSQTNCFLPESRHTCRQYAGIWNRSARRASVHRLPKGWMLHIIGDQNLLGRFRTRRVRWSLKAQFWVSSAS